jgi:hypothetical protein
MPAFSDESRVRRIGPNNGPFRIFDIRKTDPNTGQVERSRHIAWRETRIHPDLKGQRTFSLKYDRPQFLATSRVFVPAEMPGGRSYSALLDTGCASQVYVSDIVVSECDLAVYPLGHNPATDCAVGLCEIPSLKLGKLTVASPHCVYEQRQWQLRLLGIPLYRCGMIFIGLDLMRAFSYVLFDNARHEVVFSPYDPFEPNDSSTWARLPFVLEKIDDNLRMTTDLSLGEGTIHIQFDTGGAKPGLILRQAAWQRLGLHVNARDKGDGRLASYQYGRLSCHKYVLPRLSIDRLNLKNVRVYVLPDESPLLQDLEGSLSLDYFKNTVVVLDFKQSLIWIKRP